MDLEAVRRSLEAAAGDEEEPLPCPSIDALPDRFFSAFALKGLRIDLVEPGRILASITVPPSLTSGGNILPGGEIATLADQLGSAVFIAAGHPTSGVSLDINVSYVGAAFVGEEIEIEAKVLQAGKAVGVCTVELRKKKTGKIIAQARHTKYLPVSSKL